MFLALGINIAGQKELLGMRLAENEGANFWFNVLTELKKPRSERYPHRLCGWPERIPGGPHPVMHRAYGAQQHALRVMEGIQSRHSRPESD